jgi:hypothetical protein
MNKRYSSFLNLFLVVATSALMLASCGKDGSAGAEGPQGEQGPQGPQGAQGLSGADGSTILSGTGKPAVTLGKKGDYYLDRSTTNLYGPKQENNWGDPLSLKGTKGDAGSNGTNGTAGSQFLSGNGTPNNASGKDGDMYFDKENASMFGPKANGNWGLPVSLKSANSMGVKVILVKGFRFSANVEDTEPNPNAFYGQLNHLFMPATDYNSYNENGLVIVQIRDANDPSGAWSDDVFNETVTHISNSYNINGLIGLSNSKSIRLRKDGIHLAASVSAYVEDYVGGTYDQAVKSEVAKLIANYNIDIKVVMIPGSQVQVLKQQNVRMDNAKAVLEHLNLTN